MNKDKVLNLLRTHKAKLEIRFGVFNLVLFGLVTCNESIEISDVDYLVQYDDPSTSRCYFGVQFNLEDLLEYPVDRITNKALCT